MVQTYEDTTRSALLAGADQVGTAESWYGTQIEQEDI